MTKYVHIVQVHPVELGEPNLHKVREEFEFGTKVEAEDWIDFYNSARQFKYQAVYRGRVNDATGELE